MRVLTSSCTLWLFHRNSLSIWQVAAKVLARSFESIAKDHSVVSISRISFIDDAETKPPTVCTWTGRDGRFIDGARLRHLPRNSSFVFYSHGRIEELEINKNILRRICKLLLKQFYIARCVKSARAREQKTDSYPSDH